VNSGGCRDLSLDSGLRRFVSFTVDLSRGGASACSFLPLALLQFSVLVVNRGFRADGALDAAVSGGLGDGLVDASRARGAFVPMALLMPLFSCGGSCR
jgi:hypothetical protein